MRVENGVVKMDWDPNLFLLSKKAGFICAMVVYGENIVVFKDGVAFTFCDDMGPLPMNDVKKIIKDSYKIKGDKKVTVYEMDDYEEYLELMSGGMVDEDNVKYAGLTPEQVRDMEDRMKDLSPYFSFEEEFIPMQQ